VLRIPGRVESELGPSEEAIRSMDAIESESTNKEGETVTYTSVRISDLLGNAGPNPGAAALAFVANDG
jgi:hypothetical protein